jgi:hypothetical protein
MNKLALYVPGFDRSGQEITNTSFSTSFNLNNITLIGLVNNFFTLGIYIAGVVFMFWFGWGVMQYVVAGGNKERLSFARKRITFSIVGFIIVLMAYNIQSYATNNIFPAQLKNNIQTISPPTP